MSCSLALVICSLGLAGPPGPVVDADKIVVYATQALTNDWAADPLFAYVERDEVQKSGKSTSKAFEVLMVDGSDYHFPLAIDDQPLPPSRRKVELVKLREEVQRRRNQSPSARQSRIDAWKRQRAETGELLLNFPEALTLELLGEETKSGHPAYVFSATPRAGVRATTRATRVLTGIEGKAWVEKDTLHPMYVEFSVVKPVPVFGVLASVLPGTEIEIGMTKVTDSIWLIDRMSVKLSLSKMGVFRSTELTRYTYTQYRANAAVLEEFLSEAERE